MDHLESRVTHSPSPPPTCSAQSETFGNGQTETICLSVGLLRPTFSSWEQLKIILMSPCSPEKPLSETNPSRHINKSKKHRLAALLCMSHSKCSSLAPQAPSHSSWTKALNRRMSTTAVHPDSANTAIHTELSCPSMPRQVGCRDLG